MTRLISPISGASHAPVLTGASTNPQALGERGSGFAAAAVRDGGRRGLGTSLAAAGQEAAA